MRLLRGAAPIRFRSTALVRVALAVALLSATRPAIPEEPPRIGTITIRSVDVFTPEEARKGWIYSAANGVHVPTRVGVIKKFLLFRSGDPYVPALLAETERNLRAQRFIKSASVVAGPPHDGLVDVEVVTQDSWTTEPGLSFGGKGGATTFGVALEEGNFLGSGRRVTVAYDRGTDRTNRLLSIRDPNLFGPYWSGQLTYASNSDGTAQSIAIERPFSSLLSRWATAASYENLTQEDRLYARGEVASRFRQEHREALAGYGLALSASEGRARRLTAGFHSLEDEFAHSPGHAEEPLPETRRFRYLFLRYEDVQSDFVKWNYVNRDSRFEDFNLGRRLSLELAVSPDFFGVSRTTGFVAVAGEDGWRLGAESFVRARLAFESRFEPAARNAILSASLDGVRRFAGRYRPALVARLDYQRGWRLDREVQFFADGATGLRAYRLHAFEGDERILFNLEQRFFSGKELFQLVSPGAAVFFDAGTAAPPGRPLSLSQFRYDVGVGLRLGISRAARTNVFRLDLAYALRPDARGRRGMLVSFSSSQAF